MTSTPPKRTIDDMAEALHAKGLVVVSIPKAAAIEASLMAYLKNIPETTEAARQQPLGTTSFSGSSFGALNESSSFHNPASRRIRELVAEKVEPILAAYAELSGLDTWQCEQLMDRLLVRNPDQLVAPEKGHRDESTNALPGDRMFGGWLAFSEGDVFTAAEGSHRDLSGAYLPAGGTGFAPLSKEEAASLTMTRVKVPKYGFLLFHANIAHKITRKKRKTLLVRQFVGYRLTQSKEPLYHTEAPIVKGTLSRPTCGKKRLLAGHMSPALSTVFDKLVVPPLPSGQQFPMISQFAYSMHKAKKYAWLSRRFRPDLFGLKEWPSEPLPWEPIAYMDSSALLAADPSYPPYTPGERALHTPHPLKRRGACVAART